MANAGPELAAEMKDRLLDEARALEAAGASLLDFTNSGSGRRRGGDQGDSASR